MTPHRPRKAAPKDSQGCQETSPETPHSQKEKKNQKNGDRLVFLIQRFLSLFKPGLSTAQCQMHQHLFFFLPEGNPHLCEEGSVEPGAAPRAPLCICSSCPGPALPLQNKQQNTLSRFLSTPRVLEPSAPALPWGGEGGRGCSSSPLPASDSAHGNPVLN